MKSILFFLVLMAAMALVSSWVCPHDYCYHIKCTKVTKKNCAGKIKRNGSVCGCCAVCLRILKPGESCIATLFRGMPKRVTCPDGYICNSKTITCQRVIS